MKFLVQLVKLRTFAGFLVQFVELLAFAGLLVHLTVPNSAARRQGDLRGATGHRSKAGTRSAAAAYPLRWGASSPSCRPLKLLLDEIALQAGTTGPFWESAQGGCGTAGGPEAFIGT